MYIDKLILMLFDFLHKTFNNREIALIFYLIAFIIWILTKKKIRESIFTVINSLFDKQIVTSILLLLIYVSIIIFGLSILNLWNSKLIKDSIYWTFGTGFILMMNSNNAIKEENYLRKIIKKNIKVLMIVEFIVGLYVFGLITEFILMPIVIFLSILLGYTEANKEYQPVKNFLLKVFGIIGFLYLIYSSYKIYLDFEGFASYDNIRTFIFPIIMTFVFLPFIYFYALYVHYQSLFVRISFFFKDNKSLCKFAKWRILLSVNFSFKKLKLITPGYLFGGCKTKDDIKQEISEKLKNKIYR